ncbi:unnamed protein product [Linum tenue]|uniref:Uncharacterized protein n=1 Tax=Linum tenue TaxID=586396 RepID=A0AAV0IRN1_9ROSI|nr:unnamed protein product [Linum tenue]
MLRGTVACYQRHMDFHVYAQCRGSVRKG